MRNVEKGGYVGTKQKSAYEHFLEPFMKSLEEIIITVGMIKPFLANQHDEINEHCTFWSLRAFFPHMNR